VINFRGNDFSKEAAEHWCFHPAGVQTASSRNNAVRPGRDGREVRWGVDSVESDEAVGMEKGPVETETSEERKPKKMADPMKPTAQEVEEHEITCLPCRSCCWACVQGRRKGAPNRRGRERGTLPVVHLDFMFVGPKGEPGQTIPCLVVRKIISKLCVATMVPTKSVDHFVAKRIIAFLAEVGCLRGGVIVRSDQEPAMTSLVDEIGRRLAASGGGRRVVDDSPVGASASNGLVKRAIQSVQAQIRVLKLALESRCKVGCQASMP
jgi:hypothetical protein